MVNYRYTCKRHLVLSYSVLSNSHTPFISIIRNLFYRHINLLFSTAATFHYKPPVEICGK